MKKLSLCLAIAAIGILTSSAQDAQRKFKRFKGDVSLGYAAPLSSNADGGVLFALEPKFAVADQLSLGIRIEGAAMAKFTNYDNSYTNVDKAKVEASYVATADYYFTNNYSFRPFVGAGAGIFGIGNIDENTNADNFDTEDKFGGIIRAGGEVKHFRFGIEYNIIPNTTHTYNGITATSKNSYIGFKLGVCFGGGPLNN
jgi:hypothetical protein